MGTRKPLVTGTGSCSRYSLLYLCPVSSLFQCLFLLLVTHDVLVNEGLGLSSGASKMQGVLSRVRGPFTPTQWMELEHQALIYKHFAVNAPVPSSLLLPIRRSINPWSGLGSSSRKYPYPSPVLCQKLKVGVVKWSLKVHGRSK